MKNTITAKIGYKVKAIKDPETGRTRAGVYDGDHLVMVADLMGLKALDEDYITKIGG